MHACKEKSDMATSQSPGYGWNGAAAAVPDMAGTIDIWH